jgi:hypothetical protein
VLVAPDTGISTARAILLVMHVGGTFAVALLTADRADLKQLLARGALYCLPLFVVFDVAEALWWIGRGAEGLELGPISIDFGNLQSAGPLPRLAGPVADGNRAGFVLLFYLLAIGLGERRDALRRIGLFVGIACLIGTVSRSAFLGAGAMSAVLLLTKGRHLRARPLAFATAIAAAATAFALASPRSVERVSRLLATPAVVQRLSVREGSAREHLLLIERGFQEATASVPRVALGFGYGNSHLILRDIFPGHKYGNFHSLYVSMFAEAGIVALIITLVLLIAPAVRAGPWQPLVVAAIAFNVFYQSATEPSFWFALAMAWMTMAARGRPVLTGAAA